MTIRDVLTDFTIHLLLMGGEPHAPELQFFNNFKGSERAYQSYLEKVKQYADVDGFMWDTEFDCPYESVKAITNLITDKEIEFLQDYLKEEFRFGYSIEINEDGFPFHEVYGFYIGIEEIKTSFKDYLLFRSLNSSVYISYLEQYLQYLENFTKLKEFIQDPIDNFYRNGQELEPDIYSQLKQGFEKTLKADLLKISQTTTFQIIGYFDEKGFFMNYDETLKAILKSCETDNMGQFLGENSERHYIALKYKYYKFKIDRKNVQDELTDNKELRDDYNEFKNRNKVQIKYLKRKGFSNAQTDSILNVFSGNKYSSLSIREIRNLSQVDFYRLSYMLFHLEFFEETRGVKFDYSKDFQILCLAENKINGKQFLKYHERAHIEIDKNRSYKHHPFDSISSLTKLLGKVKSDLKIDLEKLKIPTNLSKHLN